MKPNSTNQGNVAGGESSPSLPFPGGSEASTMPSTYADYLQLQRELARRRSICPGARRISAQGNDVWEENAEGARRPRLSGSAPPRVGEGIMRPAPLGEEERALLAIDALAKRGRCEGATGRPSILSSRGQVLDEFSRVDDGSQPVEHDGSHESATPILWYSPPVQRQRWGEEQVLPHVNWGDLFFDLFYVAAAYNLGSSLRIVLGDVDSILRTVIYFLGTFGAVWRTWEVSMIHESRYVFVDYGHRGLSALRHLCLGMAVSHIVPDLSVIKDFDVINFVAAMFLEGVLHLGLCVEIYFKALGDREAIQNHTLAKIKGHTPVLLLYLAAWVSGHIIVGYGGGKDEGRSNRNLASLTTEPNASDSHTPGGYESDQRDMANQIQNEAIWDISDLPMTLMAIAYLLNIVITTVGKLRIDSGKHGNIRDRYVWTNVDYDIHRYKEWILLMIGEGILSLLIVDTSHDFDYYLVTVFGIVTVIFIQILKFESEPSHAQDHALWKNLHNAMCYSLLLQFLSMSLIVFGSTYKAFLYEILYDTRDGEAEHRILAEISGFDEDNRLVVAQYFSYSFSFVLLSLELLCLTHRGLKNAFRHLVILSPNEGMPPKPYWPVVGIAIFKFGLIIFSMTMWIWVTDPSILTIFGCAVVCSLVLTRVMNYFFIHRKDVHTINHSNIENELVSHPNGSASVEKNGQDSNLSNHMRVQEVGCNTGGQLSDDEAKRGGEDA